MTKKRGKPRPEEVRCPTCQAVGWHRTGERVTAVSSRAGRLELRHEFAGDGPWEWTCESCGYAVRPTSRLDNALSRVQTGRLGGIVAAPLGVLGLDGAKGGLGRVARVTAITVATAGAVVAAATLVAPSLDGPSASPPPGATPEAIAGGPEGRIELRDVLVERVTGDMTFWVRSEGKQVLVLLDERRQPEPVITVKAGQRVRIQGTIVNSPPDDLALSSQDRSVLSGESAYVLAHRVTIVD
jgi:hypothetical protein